MAQTFDIYPEKSWHLHSVWKANDMNGACHFNAFKLEEKIALEVEKTYMIIIPGGESHVTIEHY